MLKRYFEPLSRRPPCRKVQGSSPPRCWAIPLAQVVARMIRGLHSWSCLIVRHRGKTHFPALHLYPCLPQGSRWGSQRTRWSRKWPRACGLAGGLGAYRRFERNPGRLPCRPSTNISLPYTNLNNEKKTGDFFCNSPLVASLYSKQLTSSVYKWRKKLTLKIVDFLNRFQMFFVSTSFSDFLLFWECTAWCLLNSLLMCTGIIGLIIVAFQPLF